MTALVIGESISLDPNFAVICSFFDLFAKSCGVKQPSFLELQEMMESTEEISVELIDLHVRLLRKARKNVTPERWEHALARFCYYDCPDECEALQKSGYKSLNPQQKLKLLLTLIESQFDKNTKLQNEMKIMPLTNLRLSPVGKDAVGMLYWAQMDCTSNLRVYKEDLEEQTWELVADNKETLQNLILDLTRKRNSNEKYAGKEEEDISEDDEEEDDTQIDDDGEKQGPEVNGANNSSSTSSAASRFKPMSPFSDPGLILKECNSSPVAENGSSLKEKIKMNFTNKILPVLTENDRKKASESIIISSMKAKLAEATARGEKKPVLETEGLKPGLKLEEILKAKLAQKLNMAAVNGEDSKKCDEVQVEGSESKKIKMEGDVIEDPPVVVTGVGSGVDCQVGNDDEEGSVTVEGVLAEPEGREVVAEGREAVSDAQSDIGSTAGTCGSDVFESVKIVEDYMDDIEMDDANGGTPSSHSSDLPNADAPGPYASAENLDEELTRLDGVPHFDNYEAGSMCATYGSSGSDSDSAQTETNNNMVHNIDGQISINDRELGKISKNGHNPPREQAVVEPSPVVDEKVQKIFDSFNYDQDFEDSDDEEDKIKEVVEDGNEVSNSRNDEESMANMESELKSPDQKPESIQQPESHQKVESVDEQLESRDIDQQPLLIITNPLVESEIKQPQSIRQPAESKDKNIECTNQRLESVNMGQQLEPADQNIECVDKQLESMDKKMESAYQKLSSGYQQYEDQHPQLVDQRLEMDNLQQPVSTVEQSELTIQHTDELDGNIVSGDHLFVGKHPEENNLKLSGKQPKCKERLESMEGNVRGLKTEVKGVEMVEEVVLEKLPLVSEDVDGKLGPNPETSMISSNEDKLSVKIASDLPVETEKKIPETGSSLENKVNEDDDDFCIYDSNALDDQSDLDSENGNEEIKGSTLEVQNISSTEGELMADGAELVRIESEVLVRDSEKSQGACKVEMDVNRAKDENVESDDQEVAKDFDDMKEANDEEEMERKLAPVEVVSEEMPEAKLEVSRPLENFCETKGEDNKAENLVEVVKGRQGRGGNAEITHVPTKRSMRSGQSSLEQAEEKEEAEAEKQVQVEMEQAEGKEEVEAEKQVQVEMEQAEGKEEAEAEKQVQVEMEQAEGKEEAEAKKQVQVEEFEVALKKVENDKMEQDDKEESDEETADASRLESQVEGEDSKVNVGEEVESVVPAKKKPTPKRGRKRKGRPKKAASKKVIQKEPEKEMAIAKDEEGKKEVATEEASEDKEAVDNSAPVGSGASKGNKKLLNDKKRQRLLKNLNIDETKLVEALEESEQPRIRQSRRIAQIKIREQAQGKFITQFEDNSKVVGGGKNKQTPTKKGKKSLQVEEEDTDEEPEKGDVKIKKRNGKKDSAKNFNIKNPWKSSSGSSSSEKEDEEEDEHLEEEEEEMVYGKSDHEFSPESDLDDAEYKPVKRARTARRKNSVESCEEVEDDLKNLTCQKCKTSEQPDWILLCDNCDEGWHASCLRPPLMTIPEGDWFCPPCQHNKLIAGLGNILKLYNKDALKRRHEELNRKRLQYVTVNASNILPQKGSLAKGRKSPVGKEHKMDEEQDEESSEESLYDEPMYQLRIRRKENVSDKLHEFDRLINSAIQNEMGGEPEIASNEVRVVGIQPPFPSIPEGMHVEPLLAPDPVKVIEHSMEDVIDKEKDEPLEVDKNIEKMEDSDSMEESKEEEGVSTPEGPIEAPTVLLVKTNDSLPRHRKKHHPLTKLDLSSDSDGSDEDFQGGSEDEEEDEDELMKSGLESEDSEEYEQTSRRKHRKAAPTRRSTRNRRTRYDDDFVNDDSEDSEPPVQKKKKKRGYSDSDSEEDDNTWGKRKKTKKFGVVKGKKRKRVVFDGDSDNGGKGKRVRRGRVQYGLDESDSDSEDEDLPRTRGKKINYQETDESDSEGTKVKRVLKSDDEEYVQDEEDEKGAEEEEDEVESKDGELEQKEDVISPEPLVVKQAVPIMEEKLMGDTATEESMAEVSYNPLTSLSSTMASIPAVPSAPLYTSQIAVSEPEEVGIIETAAVVTPRGRGRPRKSEQAAAGSGGVEIPPLKPRLKIIKMRTPKPETHSPQQGTAYQTAIYHSPNKHDPSPSGGGVQFPDSSISEGKITTTCITPEEKGKESFGQFPPYGKPTVAQAPFVVRPVQAMLNRPPVSAGYPGLQTFYGTQPSQYPPTSFPRPYRSPYMSAAGNLSPTASRVSASPTSTTVPSPSGGPPATVTPLPPIIPRPSVYAQAVPLQAPEFYREFPPNGAPTSTSGEATSTEFAPSSSVYNNEEGQHYEGNAEKEERCSEFGGLVSYFSSQQEEDMED